MDELIRTAYIRGPLGPRGPQGPVGPKGEQGPIGLKGDKGDMGPMGPRGFQGPQGEKGDPFTYEDFTEEQLEGLRGPQGPQGEQGPQGIQGIQGIQGEKGDKGDQGIQGIQGETGPLGPKGETGETGPQGPQGIQGEKGDPFTYEDFTSAQLESLRGPLGIQGPTGPQGEQGVQGIQGEQGVQGPKGDTGDAFTIYDEYASVALMNADVDNVPVGKFVIINSNVSDPDNSKLYIRTNNTTDYPTGFKFLTDMSGAQGIQGPQGELGIQGVLGIQGIPGNDGHSPVVTASKSGSTTTIYVDGTPIATIEDGQDGQDGQNGTNGTNGTDGQDGHTPVITASKSNGVTTVSVDGEAIATINDGQDGSDGTNGTNGTDGNDGTDGITPTVTVTSISNGHNVAFSYGTGDSRNVNFDVMDGDVANQLQADWNQTNSSYSDYIKNKPTLFSGSYNDLTDLPNIPAALVQSDWDLTDNTQVDYIKNKPTIPTVPTNVSSFTNDAGYLTSHQSLTDYVQKSSTTGLLKNDGTVDTNTYLTSHLDISGKANSSDLATVATSGSYNDLTDKPTIPTVPSNQSAASGGTTLSVVTTGEKYTWNNKSNFSGNYNDLSNKPTIPTKTSDLTNDSGYIVKPDLSANGHTYVDLGLPSGALWATTNLGASSETDSGTQYTYGSSHTWLYWYEDPANIALGGHWRVPKDSYWVELATYTDNEYFSDYNNTGVACIKFTNKNDSTKYIIVPLVDHLLDESSNAAGGYLCRKKGWVGSLDYSSSIGHYVGFSSYSTETYHHAVRPVLHPNDLSQVATLAVTANYDNLYNKPTIPDALIQADWNQTTNTAKDYIKNKPDIFSGNGTLLSPSQSNVIDLNDITTAGIYTVYVTNYSYIQHAPSNLGDSFEIIVENRTILGQSFVILTIRALHAYSNIIVTRSSRGGSWLLWDTLVLSSNSVKIWSGTQAQYDAITNPDNNTIYIITSAS